ncbi:hypothetical protein LV85_02342 [Algoriphagus chordae]|uniref:Uncharacterized protein n=1 Tax=Algoriphagus chordae TaxID=237019 RepID=A0A2W7QS23_9BACT|nr:hypothetical protein LV85_02342 [Algoriphagus chordae]
MNNKMTTPTKFLIGLAWLNLIIWILERKEITYIGIEGYLGISFILICLLVLFSVMREKSKGLQKKR